jgi:glycosyltransferase involved in cell wall biosynthesis
MRVCIVTTAAYAHGLGGMQDHTDDLVTGLVAAGHSVEVIAARHPVGMAQEHHKGALWHFVDEPSDNGRWPMRNPGFYRESARKFEELHIANPFDVVHSESTSALGLTRRGVQRHVAVAVKLHGNFWGEAAAGMQRMRLNREPRSVLRETKHIAELAARHWLTPGNAVRFWACETMAPSHRQLRDARKCMLLRPSRTHVVPNGVDHELFRPGNRAELRARLGLDDRVTFVCAGRLNREKGFDQAIRALAMVNLEAPRVRLIIIGDGEERGSLDRLVRELHMQDHVRFCGMLSHDVLADYLAAADCFLFPTQKDEAAGLVLLQAMSAGLPVVAADSGAVPEAINAPGSNGLLVPRGDHPALAREMRRLVTDVGLREALGTAARDRVLRDYTLDRITERTVGVYELARSRIARR